MLMNHRTLSQSIANSLTVSNKIPLNPFPARQQVTRGECEEWNPVTCESRSLKTPPEASSILVHWSTDRVVGELRTLTSHAGLLSHHSSGEEDSDGPTARSSRSRFLRKIVGTHGRRYLNSGMLTETVGDEDGVGGGLEKGWHGMAWRG